MSRAVPPNRRQFIGRVGKTTAAVLAANAIGLEPFLGSNSSTASAASVNPLTSQQRRNKAYAIRNDTARANMQATSAQLAQTPNTDDERYPDKRGSYSKGLPHNADGTVVLNAYNSMMTALKSGAPSDFNSIILGGDRRLTNPQAGFAFEMEGGDAQSFVQPPAPAFSSREECAEIAENYWMALLRDVPYSEYASNSLAQAAAADLTNFGADFKGAKNGSGQVTTQTLFRGLTAGDKVGPYLSQFFYLPCFFGANEVDQKIVTAAPFSTALNGSLGGGRDYVTTFSDWLSVQNGVNQPAGVFDDKRRYMRMGRDIGQWVHVDVLFQGYFQAFLVLSGLGAAVDDGNPYKNNPTQDGFGTFGGPHIATLLCEVSTRALHAVWYQKWLVHRRLRPEAFAGRIEYNRTHAGRFDIDPSINSSTVLEAVRQHNEQLNGAGNGTYLLPLAFPEGSPTHPAYGAGHATVAGACTTILKAWFKESTTIASLTTPVQPTPDGESLGEYTGGDAGQMTVGGELNKIASNIALGRNTAGVHWRSDGTESIKLGEAIALNILRELRACYNEDFGGFSLTKFDGTTINV